MIKKQALQNLYFCYNKILKNCWKKLSNFSKKGEKKKNISSHLVLGRNLTVSFFEVSLGFLVFFKTKIFKIFSAQKINTLIAMRATYGS